MSEASTYPIFEAAGPDDDCGDAPCEAPEGAPPQIFKLTRYDEIGAEQRKEWIVDDFLGVGEMTAIYGAPGAGKSVLVGDIAAHIGAGIPWFGRDVRHGAVLYVAAERAALVKRRLAAWRERHLGVAVALAVIEGSFDLCGGPEHSDEIGRIAVDLGREHGLAPALVIVDTKTMVLGGHDPNSDAHVAALVRSLDRIRRATGAAVCVIDHTPYGAPDRIKGSGTLPGAIDGSFLVKQVGGDRSIVIGAKRPNDGPDEFEIHFGLQGVVVGTAEAGVTTEAPVVVPVEATRVPAVPGAPVRVKLSPTGQKVYSAFGRLHDEGRTIPVPGVPGVRPGTLAVSVTALREKTFEMGIVDEPEPAQGSPERDKWMDNRRQAWRRGRTDVESKGRLRIEAEFAWDPAHGRTVTPGVTNTVTYRVET